MMNLFRFAAAIVLLAGWGLAALSLHVVRTASSVQLIPKNQLSIEDTYVDVRAWTSADEEKHPTLLARLKQLDRTNLLEAVADAPVAPTIELASPEPVAAHSKPANTGHEWNRINLSKR